MRIEICGGSGSGKTTLVSSVKDPAYTPVLEAFSNGGMFPDFYEERELFAYEVSVSCLLYHLHRVKAAARTGLPMICDFSIEQDWAYAKNNLSRQEWASFLPVYEEVVRQIRPPDLIVFLECPAQVLLSRIRERGRTYEAAVGRDYLEGVTSLLRARLGACGVPVLEVDSTQYDFRNPGEVSRLLPLLTAVPQREKGTQN